MLNDAEEIKQFKKTMDLFVDGATQTLANFPD